MIGGERVGAFLLGLLGWLFTVGVTVWYLRTVRQMHEEMQAMRRYLQAIYERLDRR